jgi:protocatechuate 3,4-dioxygenase beta subunit
VRRALLLGLVVLAALVMLVEAPAPPRDATVSLPGERAIAVSVSLSLSSGETAAPASASVSEPVVVAPVAGALEVVSVRGRVVDEKGEPVSGASVVLCARGSGPAPVDRARLSLLERLELARLREGESLRELERGVSAGDGTFRLTLRVPSFAAGDRLSVRASFENDGVLAINGDEVYVLAAAREDRSSGHSARDSRGTATRVVEVGTDADLDLGEVRLKRAPRLQVVVRAEGHVVPGASVFTSGGGNLATETTDATGVAEFLVPGSSSRSINIRVSLEGFATDRRRLRAASGNMTVDVELARPVAIEGRVLGPGGAPQAGAEIQLVQLDESGGLRGSDARAECAADGRYTFAGLVAGATYSLLVVGSDWTLAPASRSVTAPAVDADLVLLLAGSVVVKARGPGPSDTPTFELDERDEDGHFGPCAWTKTPPQVVEGTWTVSFSRLAPGVYRTVVSAPGFAPAVSTPVTVDPGVPAETTVELAPGRTITGRVLLGDGKPASSARVEYERFGHRFGATTDDDGRFTLDGAPLEALELIFEHVSGEVRVTAGLQETRLPDVTLSAR